MIVKLKKKHLREFRSGCEIFLDLHDKVELLAAGPETERPEYTAVLKPDYPQESAGALLIHDSELI